jgi:hypothetical protein
MLRSRFDVTRGFPSISAGREFSGLNWVDSRAVLFMLAS